MMDEFFEFVGKLTIAVLLILTIWPFFLPAVQALSVTLLAIVATVKADGYKAVPYRHLHKVYWNYYKSIAFSIGDVTKLENRYYVWRGTFKWHIKGK
jgi:hypothetical protein